MFDVDIKGGATILESRTTIAGDAIHAPCETPIGKSELDRLRSRGACYAARVSLLTEFILGCPSWPPDMLRREPRHSAQLGGVTANPVRLRPLQIRFPEVSLSLRRQGAQIITYPSAFTLKTGAAHWEVLLRARAIETQSYVLAPAQTGSHSETRQSYGHALIVDPWGAVVAQCADKQPKGDSADEGTFALAEIDLEWLEQIRREMPLWEQRRPEVYPIL